MKLNELQNNYGASKSALRVGRGIGSGKGKTCGRGVKGQKSRSGVAIKGFEGGQMPLYRRLPKRGFNNIFAVSYDEVNVGDIQACIEGGKLDVSSKITINELKSAGLVRNSSDKVKILGSGEFGSKVDIEVDKISASASKIIEGAGGSVSIVPSKKKFLPTRRG